jgi:hypothetical protein
MRINKRQEFVIGGETVGGTTFDALILANTKPRDVYVARTRNGSTPAIRVVSACSTGSSSHFLFD